MSEVVLILLEPTGYDLPTGLLAAIGVLLRVQAQGFPGGFQSAKRAGLEIRGPGQKSKDKKQRSVATYNLSEIRFAVWALLAVITSVFPGVQQPDSATSMTENAIAVVGHIRPEMARGGQKCRKGDKSAWTHRKVIERKETKDGESRVKSPGVEARSHESWSYQARGRAKREGCVCRQLPRSIKQGESKAQREMNEGKSGD